MHNSVFRALLLCLLLAACDVRERPSVVEPDISSSLFVEIVRPLTSDNATTIAGGQLFVTVRGREDGGRLTGVGLLVRRQPARFVDSVAVRFAPGTDTTYTFVVTVPDTLPNNSQLDLTGIAYGTGDASRTSEREAVIVLQCPPAATWCR